MKLLISLLFTCTILGTSCNSTQNKTDFTDDELMIKVPSTELYVRVRGNPDKPLIVNLHGGPSGYSGIDIKLMGPGLEDNFLVAYLDQRGCGKSPKCTNKKMLTINQYIEDLDIVIDSLRSKYNKEKNESNHSSVKQCSLIIQ